MSGAADVTNGDSQSECPKEEMKEAESKEEQNETNTVEEEQSKTLNVKKELLEEFHVEKQLEPKTAEKQKEGPLVELYKGRIEGDTISNEIRSTYQKLLDGKEQVVDSEEFKNILTEAKNLILRVKGSQGATHDIDMYDLLCHEVEEMSKVANTDHGKFHVEDNALTIKFAPVALDTKEVEMTKELSHLPNELVMYIFLMLSPEDKKKAVLLNKRLGKVGEHPLLWKWCVIRITCGEDINKLSFKRFLEVQKIIVHPYYDWQPHQLEELLKATLKLLKLKKIAGLSRMDLSSVNSELLATALSKLEHIALVEEDITTNDQLKEIFKQIAEKGLIRKLSLANIDLRPLELDAGVLATAMSTPQKLVLRLVDLTSDQAQELFKAMLENNRLKTVSLVSMDLSSVGGHMIGAALAKLETVFLENNNLRNEQVGLLFTELSKNCKLNYLSLAYDDLSSVNPDILTTVVNHIGAVQLVNTQLTTHQISTILTEAEAENSRLKRLNLEDDDISEIDPTLIERVKEKIELYINTYDLGEEDESDEDDDGSGEEAVMKRMEEVMMEVMKRQEDDIENEEEEDEEDSLDVSIVSESDTELDGEKEMESDN